MHEGVPASPPAWRRPLPFLYESTGLETYFTNSLDLDAKARYVFAFHLPETLREWLDLIPAASIQSGGYFEQMKV